NLRGAFFRGIQALVPIVSARHGACRPKIMRAAWISPFDRRPFGRSQSRFLMTRVGSLIMAPSRSLSAARTIVRLVGDVARLVSGMVRSHAQLAAENLFLRSQEATRVVRGAAGEATSR